MGAQSSALRASSAHTQEAKEADGFPVQGADGADAKFPSSEMGAPEKRPRTVSAALSLARGAVIKKMRSQPRFQTVKLKVH